MKGTAPMKSVKLSGYCATHGQYDTHARSWLHANTQLRTNIFRNTKIKNTKDAINMGCTWSELFATAPENGYTITHYIIRNSLTLYQLQCRNENCQWGIFRPHGWMVRWTTTSSTSGMLRTSVCVIKRLLWLHVWKAWHEKRVYEENEHDMDDKHETNGEYDSS